MVRRGSTVPCPKHPCGACFVSCHRCAERRECQAVTVANCPNLRKRHGLTEEAQRHDLRLRVEGAAQPALPSSLAEVRRPRSGRSLEVRERTPGSTAWRVRTLRGCASCGRSAPQRAKWSCPVPDAALLDERSGGCTVKGAPHPNERSMATRDNASPTVTAWHKKGVGAGRRRWPRGWRGPKGPGGVSGRHPRPIAETDPLARTECPCLARDVGASVGVMWADPDSRERRNPDFPVFTRGVGASFLG